MQKDIFRTFVSNSLTKQNAYSTDIYLINQVNLIIFLRQRAQRTLRCNMSKFEGVYMVFRFEFFS